MKTKTLSVLITFFLIVNLLSAQNIDYKAATIQLIPETTFLANADWESLFYDASKTNAVEKAGLNKQIAIGPNERVYISDRSKFTITILDKTGKQLKTFGKQGYKNGEFVNNQDLNGILSNKYLVVSDNQGRINFFDLDGNFVKLITIDFMPLRIFPLKSGNLIVWGHVPVKGSTYKTILAEINYTTGKYTVFDEVLSTGEKPDRIIIPTETSMIAIGSPYAKGNKFIRITGDDQVVFADSKSKAVKLYSKIDGKYRLSEFNIAIDPIKIGDQEKMEYYENLKAKLKKKGMDVSYAEKVLEDGFFPEHLPYFYNMILDNENNALLFIYTNNENQDYAFRAYSLDGKILGQSEFKIEGYDLLSKMGHFKFKDGFIYTLALKKGEEFPLRILKYRME